jgi:hypothetical protein
VGGYTPKMQEDAMCEIIVEESSALGKSGEEV